MRYLSVDYGEKRIGLALSDPGGRIAFPHTTVSRLEDVVDVVAAERAGAVVIGLPLTLGGAEGEAARAVRRFAARLAESVQLPIAFENEAFTTNIAERHAPREKADAAAAALILQSYLDKRNAKLKSKNSK